VFVIFIAVTSLQYSLRARNQEKVIPLEDPPTNDSVSNLLYEVINILMGEETVMVAEYLINNPGAIDEEIAENIEMNIKAIRNCLFKLNEQSLAKFRRIRNTETGYFVYYWNFEPERLLHLVERRKKQILKLLAQRAEYEERNLLYRCDGINCLPVVLDRAYELDFTCPDCGEPLDQQDNEKIQKFIQKLTDKLSNLI